MSLELQRISRLKTDGNGNIKIVAAMSPMLAAQAIVENMQKCVKPCELKITALYRIVSDDPSDFSTWKHADLYPVKVDVIVAEINCRYLIVLGDLGGQVFNIALKMEDDVLIHDDYKQFPWIKSPNEDDIIQLIKTVDIGCELRAFKSTIKKDVNKQLYN